MNKLTDIERFGREGRVDEEHQEPDIPPFQEKEHLRSWLGDSTGRDQFAMYRADTVGVFWNRKKEQPDRAVTRENWTELFITWSPLGTFLTSTHQRGVQLWGGQSWNMHMRFPHPNVNLIDFSPNELYIVTWSAQPMQVDENHPALSMDDDGKNYVVWEIRTGKPIRSFGEVEIGEMDKEKAAKIQRPTFKWSSDDKYLARLNPGQSVSVYELPKMVLIDKTPVPIDGVSQFEWCPSLPSRDGIKSYEQIFAYWSPEEGSTPAKVGIMSIPSRAILRTRTLFNVTDVKMRWQSESAYLAIKVDRHSKSGKSLATNLEVMRVKEKGVPIEVIEAVKETVVDLAWEPKGDRFVIITVGEAPPAGSAVPPKTSISFFTPDQVKGSSHVGNFRCISTTDKKNQNSLFWSPKGRFIVVGTIASSQSSDLDFWDMGEKDLSEKEAAAALTLMNTADHYGVTDVGWDATGRYVITSSSIWRNAMEAGFHLYDFRGMLLREETVEGIKQIIWRPRPQTLLSKDEMRAIRKNLREYSKGFDEEDLAEAQQVDEAVVTIRREKLDEWLAWRRITEEDLDEERQAMGVETAAEIAEVEDGDKKMVEQEIEEIVNEEEEIVT